MRAVNVFSQSSLGSPRRSMSVCALCSLRKLASFEGSSKPCARIARRTALWRRTSSMRRGSPCLTRNTSRSLCGDSSLRPPEPTA